jgi:hypothetical protein
MKSHICCARMDFRSGEVAEWSIASDLKSDEVKASESSNLSFSVLIKEWWLRFFSATILFLYLVCAPAPLLPASINLPPHNSKF